MSQMEGRRPKVLFVLPANIVGGAEIRTFHLLRGICAGAFAPVLLTHKKIADTYAELTAPLHFFDAYGCRDPYLYSPANVIAYARAIGAVARLEKPDIIFGWMHNGTLFVTAAALFYRLKSRLVGSILGPVSAHFSYIGRAPSRYEKLLMRFCFNRLNGIVTNSHGVRQDLIDNFWAPPMRVRTIYNGIDTQIVTTKAQEAVPIVKDCPWIVSSCRLSPEKDFNTLLNAFCLVRAKHRVKLLVVGDGPNRDEILRQASALGVDQDLVLTGFARNPFPYVARAEIFVLSSFLEGFGNVIVEAMALGVPVVASNCPCGPAEIIQDGSSGFLFPVGDAETLAVKCLRLLEDHDLRTAMARHALARSTDFTLQAMVAGFEAYFSELLSVDYRRQRASVTKL